MSKKNIGIEMNSFCLINLDSGRAVARSIAKDNDYMKIIFSSKKVIEQIKKYCLENGYTKEEDRMEIIEENNKKLIKIIEDNSYGKLVFLDYKSFVYFIEN